MITDEDQKKYIEGRAASIITSPLTNMVARHLLSMYEDTVRLYVHYFKEQKNLEQQAYGLLKSVLGSILRSGGYENHVEKTEQDLYREMHQTVLDEISDKTVRNIN